MSREMAQSSGNTTLADVHVAAARIIDDQGYGGLDKTAGAIGMSPDTLGKKLREEGNHKLSDRQAAAIADFWDSDRLAEAHAARRGKVLVALPDLSGVSDTALLECWTRMMSEFGDFSTAFHKALEGGITPDEMARIDAEHRQFMSASIELTNRMRQLVKPEAPGLKAVKA